MCCKHVVVLGKNIFIHKLIKEKTLRMREEDFKSLVLVESLFIFYAYNLEELRKKKKKSVQNSIPAQDAYLDFLYLSSLLIYSF